MTMLLFVSNRLGEMFGAGDIGGGCWGNDGGGCLGGVGMCSGGVGGMLEVGDGEAEWT